MKTVKGNVYGKEYTLACDPGQEAHLEKLVSQINARTITLEKAVGKLPEPMMLLYVALMVADELHDATRDNARLKDELKIEKEAVEKIKDQIKAYQSEIDAQEVYVKQAQANEKAFELILNKIEAADKAAEAAAAAAALAAKNKS